MLWFLQESTNLKAIHNLPDCLFIGILLWFLQESTNLKAIHNFHMTHYFSSKLWFLQESTNLKAIHNNCSLLILQTEAVIPTGKYQFESNSQQQKARAP